MLHKIQNFQIKTQDLQFKSNILYTHGKYFCQEIWL